MKIKINNREIEVINSRRNQCGAGYYWTTAYVYQGSTLATFNSGPTHQPPAPLDILDATREYTVEDHAAPDADTHTGINWDGSPITWDHADPNSRVCMCGSRKFAGLRTHYTIRQKIEWALAQICDE